MEKLVLWGRGGGEGHSLKRRESCIMAVRTLESVIFNKDDQKLSGALILPLSSPSF